MEKLYKDKTCNIVTVMISLLLLSFLTMISQTSFAQNDESSGDTSGPDIVDTAKPPAEHMVKSTDDGFLILAFDTGGDREQTTITFLDPTTKKPVASVDYDIIVREANTSNIVWKASKEAGHEDRPLRTENGFAPISDDSFSPGSYAVEVLIYGINWNQLQRVDQRGAIYQISRSP